MGEDKLCDGDLVQVNEYNYHSMGGKEFAIVMDCIRHASSSHEPMEDQAVTPAKPKVWETGTRLNDP